MHDTPMYEAALRRKGSGEVAVVSVKSGPSNPVPMQELALAAGSAKAYAYSTHGLYSGNEDKVIRIKTSELVGFIKRHPELLPPRIARWPPSSP